MFTEPGSSAPQMTAAKVMNVTARLPDCAGQAADAVSAKTQSQNVQIFGDVNRDTSGRNLGPTSMILWFVLNEICMVTHPFAG